MRPLPNRDRSRGARLCAIVADSYDLAPSMLHLPTAERHITRPRQVAMWLLREMYGWSTSQIGRYFGGKHHTTALYACREVERQAQGDPEFAAALKTIRERVEAATAAAGVAAKQRMTRLDVLETRVAALEGMVGR